MQETSGGMNLSQNWAWKAHKGAKTQTAEDQCQQGATSG